VITSDGYWIIIITRANRCAAKTPDEKAALLDSMLAYSGKYTICRRPDKGRGSICPWHENLSSANVKIRRGSLAWKATSSLFRTGPNSELYGKARGNRPKPSSPGNAKR